LESRRHCGFNGAGPFCTIVGRQLYPTPLLPQALAIVKLHAVMHVS
jgi:hypothetical protein